MTKLGPKRLDVLIDRGAGAYGDREIAVQASPGAERDVDVEMTRGHK
jgi:hypothetical protein